VRSGANVKVTTATSDESNPKTNNPNQYGDYMGIAASGGFAFPVWTDHRSNKAGAEEIYVDPPLPIPGDTAATAPASVTPFLDAQSGDSDALWAVPLAELPLGWPTNLRPALMAQLPQAPALGVVDGSTGAFTPPTAGPSPASEAGTVGSEAQPVGVLDPLFAPLDAALSSDRSLLTP
jgi:hypothetical protein